MAASLARFALLRGSQQSKSLLRPPVRSVHGSLQRRPVSFSAVPKAAFRVFRASALATGVGAGAAAYASAKVDGFRNEVNERYEKAKEWGKGTYSTASEGISSALDSAGETLAQGKNTVATSLSAASTWTNAQASSFRDWFNGKNLEDDEGTEYYEEYDNTENQKKSPPPPSSLLATAAAAAAASDFSPISDDPSGDLMLLTKKLIEIRSILLSIDHGDALHMPSIVVIGSQSSGKSSVLEAIVGHEFLPKGNNMVTRRPIELTLVHTPPTADNTKPRDFAEFIGDHSSGQIFDFGVVQQRLTELNLAVPQAEAVSPVPIQLRIHSPRVPDLSLVDLPGYIQISSMDQPEELKDKIASLCDKYIRKNNIILAVCSADVDLANSPALRASRKADPLGLRTIGVVTKMDLVSPQHGASILQNERYPLALGYIGVICKAVAEKEAESHKAESSIFSGFTRSEPANNADLLSPVVRQEKAYFTTHAQEFNVPGMQVGVNTLKRRLMHVLEESMAASLSTISDKVSNELEEASYQFKVQYNDRSISAESYVAETMDYLKQRVAEVSKQFGKPQARAMLRQEIDMLVLDTLAPMYWSDPKLKELSVLAADTRKVPTSAELDPYWIHKLEASTSQVTKAGIGRKSTNLLAQKIRSRMAQIASEEPLCNHPNAAQRIEALTDAILHERFALTAEQVENSVKPLKKEVEVESTQWEAGRLHSIALLEEELKQCVASYSKIQEMVGTRKLRNAQAYIRDYEEKERQRYLKRLEARANGQAGNEEDDLDPNRPVYNPNLLVKAREANFLVDRADVLKMRTNALKAKRCKAGPDNSPFCPEAFLSAVAAQLTYTAIQHINMELLGEFFYQFPREIDSRYHLQQSEIIAFARENPHVRQHLDLQDRKQKLELVREKLDSLVKLQAEKTGIRRPERRGLFGLF